MRSLKAAALVAGIGLCHLSLAQAPVATVAAVEPTRVADIVLLHGGYNAGLRQGMVCRLTRGNTEVAEVLLVDLRPEHGAALILRVSHKQVIRPGDFASIKIIKA